LHWVLLFIFSVRERRPKFNLSYPNEKKKGGKKEALVCCFFFRTLFLFVVSRINDVGEKEKEKRKKGQGDGHPKDDNLSFSKKNICVALQCLAGGGGGKKRGGKKKRGEGGRTFRRAVSGFSSVKRTGACTGPKKGKKEKKKKREKKAPISSSLQGPHTLRPLTLKRIPWGREKRKKGRGKKKKKGGGRECS